MVKIEKSLIVIPKKENVQPYYKKSDSQDHIDIIAECASYLNLDVLFDNNIFLKEGCIEIQTCEDPMITLAIIYLPASISKKQYDYLLQMKDYFKKFKYFEVGVWNGKYVSITFDKDFPREKRVDSFYEMIDEMIERRSLL